jgi:predicted TIM-barrel fold metal-dependent hydrolase
VLKKIKKVDVHHHITPKEYVERLACIGITESYGQSFPKWTPKTSLKFMEKLGITTAIVSISTPGVSLKDKKFSKNLARMCNEYMSEMKKNYSSKFGSFASIPLLNVEDAIEELDYALDKLNLDGVGLFTNISGKYLGDEAYEELPPN